MKQKISSWLPLILWVVLFYFISVYHVASIHYNLFLLALIFSAFLIVGIYLFWSKKSRRGAGTSRD
ncbi:MAG: hypothetical protein DSY91_04650 [Deltaproteobacteria bacterium]|nr:MAG: hypothetical protein DSY91_04650 [Deltaproteobacteria bacterium]